MINSSERINDNNHELLLKIRISYGKKKYLEIIKNKYYLDENDDLINQNPCFFLLKRSKIEKEMNKYQLNPGEIIKIGRITMRIRDIKFQNNKNNNINNNNIETENNNNKKIKNLETTERVLNINKIISNNNDNIIRKKNMKKIAQKELFSKLEKKNRVCRICYLEEDPNSPDDPLIQPCICSGSMKFIHLTCLRKWVSTRSCVRIDDTPDCKIFLIKPVVCELCKTKFPDFIKYENRLFPVIDFSKEFENFLTLESLTLDRENNKFIYVISLDENKKIKVGRGHEAKVNLSDISVSRIHCIMTVINHKVFIEDNDSKFGTLILVQTPSIKLVENLPLYIQVGRSFFECKLIKAKSFNCCNSEEKNEIYYYYNQNEKFIRDHLGMVIKSDLSDFDEDSMNNENIMNNTFEQKLKTEKINKYESIFNNINEKNSSNEKNDKISDNEYLLLKHNKKTKNIKKEMIYNDTEEDKKDNDNIYDDNNNINENNNNEGDNNDDFDDSNNEENITASLNDEDDSNGDNKNNSAIENN